MSHILLKNISSRILIQERAKLMSEDEANTILQKNGGRFLCDK
jgi:hypothetical protein